jgi:N-acetylglucosamine kinase-like BadF-type ATPase
VNQAPAAVIAIDGGNSKTDLALVAADGSLLATERGPGMPVKLSAANVDLIAELLRAASAKAGLSPELRDLATATVACVANVDLPEDERQLERMLAAQGWTSSTQVANDTFAVLRAGLDDVPAAGAGRRWGVGVTCGAGINCAGLAPDGRTAGYLALGQLTGDWGGGFSLGLEAQWHAIRAEDGRGPSTVLRRLVPAHFGLAEPSEVAVAVHQGTIGFGRFGELSPLVLQAADDGDAVARSVVLHLAEEIGLMVIAVVRRLGLATARVPVVLGGGVLAANNPLLITQTTARITAEVPGCAVRVVQAAPVAGAALLGLDRIGAPVSAMRRLRESFGLKDAGEPWPSRHGEPI